MSKTTFLPFDASKVTLKGTNIIEASAGTGKTYSIAILVLRLLIEEDLPLTKILMVTFTKAAVAELEVRIRFFIRQAMQVADGLACDDQTIVKLIEQNIGTLGEDMVKQRLQQARQQLDETSIFTIHGFCQRTLSEYAFETGQLFNATMDDKVDEFTQEAVDSYWRKHIATLPEDQLLVLKSNGCKRDTMANVVKKILSNKQMAGDFLPAEDCQKQLSKVADKLEETFENFLRCFERSEECQLQHFQSNKNAVKAFGDHCNNAHAFFDVLIQKSTTKYVEKFFPSLLEAALEVKEQREKAQEILPSVYAAAAEYIVPVVHQKEKDWAVLSFNDLISNLSEATHGPSHEDLIALMQQKYSAVFIDEFQDTDQKQYEIFDTFFSSNTTVFYIGDPKQSIYGFRGADLDTYKKAVKKADHRYTMDTNYRSSVELIAAYNQFYEDVPNAFEDDHIQYETVKAAGKKPLLYDNKPIEKPLVVTLCPNKPSIMDELVHQVRELLSDASYQINGRAITPSDIGILTRGKGRANELKTALAKHNIPAITIDDAKVLQSTEAQFILFLLEAVQDPSLSNLNRALLSPFTGFSQEDLLTTSNEWDTAQFRRLAQVWKKEGVFAMCKQFMSLYQIQHHIADNKLDHPERIISNLLQVMELIHKRSNQANYSPRELIVWLQQVKADGNKANGDEFAQRLESDENAVQIVTIHKSKGLAYNIVLAPDLDLKVHLGANKLPYDFKTEDKYQFSYTPSEEETRRYTLQNEQENRRLIYVALTRAVHLCYVYRSTREKNTSLEAFITGLEYNPHVRLAEPRDDDAKDKLPAKYKSTKQADETKELNYKGKKISTQWRNTSFSALSDAHGFTPYQPSGQQDYNHFAFDLLPRGAESGNLLHYLFENIKYNTLMDNNTQYERVILRATEQFHSFYRKEDGEVDTAQYINLIEHTLNSSIEIGNDSFCLSDINDNLKLPELEFSFALKNTNIKAFAKKAGVTNFQDLGTIEGMLSGFVDLVFQHDGKFYILDWKSNYIGNELSDYTADKVRLSMEENNYHFQYLIYTIAVRRFLEQNLPGFDYEKHFGGAIYVYLRGCRTGKNYGMYTTRPSLETLDAIEDTIK